MIYHISCIFSSIIFQEPHAAIAKPIESVTHVVQAVNGYRRDRRMNEIETMEEDLAELDIQSFIPSYATAGWQPWEPSDGPCPAGYTCTSMGGKSFGAFSCDESKKWIDHICFVFLPIHQLISRSLSFYTVARIAVDVYGFGNVLAGIWCPSDGTHVRNCPVGSYCPDSATRIQCPKDTFCPYKTSQPTFEGGGRECNRCDAGVESPRLSTSQKIIQWILFSMLCLVIIIKIVRRHTRIDKLQLKRKLNIDFVKKDKEGASMNKLDQEKYAKLKPKLEVISERLGKIRNDGISSSKDNTVSILHVSKSGDIMFDANEFFDVIDKDKDGEVSFSELNEIMCLGDDQLRVFMANMMKEVSSPSQRSKVPRATFHLNFIDALTDAAHLEPTPEEVEDIFCQIAKDSDGKVPYNKLYMSPTLTSFLSDRQIYGIISQFKKQHLESRTQRQVSFSRSVSVSMMANREGGGISKHDFCKNYPRYLKEVTQPNFINNRSLVMGRSVLNESRRGLDVAFENLCLTVTVGKKQVNVLDDVTGRLSSNTMTAVMGGSGSGKSSLLNALCGRAHYGVVSGEIYINGHGNSKIEDHKSVIGFVPQEDIVYPDLSVRENLLFAGRLMLPGGTTSAEISELADATLASLGLSRVADSLVGDEKRRGISGGEKKRVNIGLELMKKPNILFLE